MHLRMSEGLRCARMVRRRGPQARFAAKRVRTAPGRGVERPIPFPRERLGSAGNTNPASPISRASSFRFWCCVPGHRSSADAEFAAYSGCNRPVIYLCLLVALGAVIAAVFAFRRTRRGLGAICLILGFAFIAGAAWFWWGQRDGDVAADAIAFDQAKQADASSGDGAAPVVGAIRLVGDAGSGAGIRCPSTLAALDAMERAKTDGEAADYDEAGASITLRAGDRVQIVDRNGPTHVQLRLLSGDDSGSDCWTDGDVRGLFR